MPQLLESASLPKNTTLNFTTLMNWTAGKNLSYLALGRPVVTQDTGLSRFIPADRGVIAFYDIKSPAEALERIVKDKEQHGRWAREIAEEFFDSNKVLKQVLEKVI